MLAQKMPNEVASLKQQLRHMQAHMSFAIYAIYTIMMCFVYMILSGVLHYLSVHYHETVYNTVIMLLVMCGAQLLMIKHMKRPFREFGFKLSYWRHSLPEAVLWSVGFCVVITLLQLLLIDTVPALNKLHLFAPGVLAAQGGAQSWPMLIGLAAVYIVFCPLQTFLINGALQSPILNIPEFKHARWVSIIMATLGASAVHSIINFTFSLSMIIPGFLWAFMYARYRSMVPVIVSHIIIGLWALFIIGYGQVFQVLSGI